jgi:hypothetical protein
MKLTIMIFIPVAIFLVWLLAGRTFCHVIDLLFVRHTRVSVPSIQFSPMGLSINSLAFDSNEQNRFLLDTNNRLVFYNGQHSFTIGDATSLSDTETNWKVYSLTPNPSDQISLKESHSLLFWKEPFKMNFITGHTPDRYRFRYYTLQWKKSSGATLIVKWQYEQYFNAETGWGSDMTPGNGYTYGITSLEISGSEKPK